MRQLSLLAGVICVTAVLGSSAYAQQQPAPPAPPAWPLTGPTITIEQAKKAAAVAVASGKATPYVYAFAVVDPTSGLVYFEKNDGVLIAATEIAINKARTTATFNRPTKAFFDAMESGHSSVATLAPYLIAAAGGIPLMVDGKVIGGIGVSGSPTGLLDSIPAQAGADALK